MFSHFTNFIFLLLGCSLVFLSLILKFILIESSLILIFIFLTGLVIITFALTQLKNELKILFKSNKIILLSSTTGSTIFLIFIFLLTTLFNYRIDMTSSGKHSISEQTLAMLEKLDNPVHITFFNDPIMRETTEIYDLIANSSEKITIDYVDPMANPAKARMMGVEFAGSAILDSGDRRIRVNSPTEIEIANSILKVSQGLQQLICFLDGHNENDPFSLEHHDHYEDINSNHNHTHSHSLDTKVVIHERHGMAKARIALESMNYLIEKKNLSVSNNKLDDCDLLIIAGPKIALSNYELEKIVNFIDNGGNIFLMQDPYIKSGLEEIISQMGILLNNDLIIDEPSHFWTDISAPAVTRYNRHNITEGLPLTFYVGARSLSPTKNSVPGYAITPLVNSSKGSYSETNTSKINFDSDQDQLGPHTIMVVAVRNPKTVEAAKATQRSDRSFIQEKIKKNLILQEPKFKSKIVVVGDSDFATNSFFHILGNGNIFLNTVNFILAQKNLIGIEPKTYDSPKINLTNRQMKGTFVLSIVFIPSLLLLVGIIIWWRQR